MQQILTVELIKAKLQTDVKWIESAVRAIYKRQTAEEQAAGSTIEENGRGFSGVDAVCGTIMGKWLMQGNHLNEKWLAKAKKIMPKYAKQLLDAAQQKAGTQEVLVDV